MKQLIEIFWAQIVRELLINLRRPSACLNPLIFFVMVCVLFPLAIAPEKNLLHAIAPGIIWVAALLASMLGIESLFQQDYEDGNLEQMLLNPAPLSVLVIAKIIAQWLLNAVPLILITPLLGLMLQMQPIEIMVLLLTLLLGTPTLCCVGAIGAAITLSLAGRGVLLAVLIMPLMIPVLILGAGSVVALMSGVAIGSLLLILLALLIIAIVFTPFATAAALRISQYR